MSNENTPSPVTEDTLNSFMEFDHVIRVLPGGAVTHDTPGVYAPESLDMEVDGDGQSIHADDSDIKGQAKSAGWALLTGYTGQYSYNGPVMHPSEFIGGGLARHILETPGYYVALTVEAPCNDYSAEFCSEDTGCNCEPAGWAVAYREAPDFSAVTVQDVYHYGNERTVTVSTFAALTARLETEAGHGATRETLAARRANVAAALEELKDTGRSDSWGWHTLTIQAGA